MTREDQMGMVEDCENSPSRMTEWEANFIDSARTQLEDGYRLSDRQEEVLEGIWRKLC